MAEMIKNIFGKFTTTVRAVTKKVRTVLGQVPPRKLQFFLALTILAIGFGSMALLQFMRKAPVKKEQTIIPPLVKAQTISQQDIQMIVRGYGTVGPKVEAEVSPQVSGKVVMINPEFKDGGFVRAGEVLIRIDPRDYELAVQRAEADVAQAEVELDLEKAEAEVARQEWDQLNPGKEPPSPLIVRQPQIRQAQTRLQAAEAQLAIAKLNLERTEVSVPFDGRVINKAVDLGQYVVTGRSIGRIYGIEAVEIEVPLEDRELAWFDIPASLVSANGNTSRKIGAEVEVRSEFAGGVHLWQGRVVRTTGEVDKTSRLVSVVVEVPEPFKAANGRPPLVPGMFVESYIKGKVLKNVLAVPRVAVREGNQVWVVNDGRLHVGQLNIARVDETYAYVVSGLQDRVVVILSSLDAVVEGMRVRTELTE